MKQWFTIVGIYADNEQPYTSAFYVESLAEAEAQAREEAGDELVIAAVFGGQLTPLQ